MGSETMVELKSYLQRTASLVLGPCVIWVHEEIFGRPISEVRLYVFFRHSEFRRRHRAVGNRCLHNANGAQQRRETLRADSGSVWRPAIDRGRTLADIS